ncbi:MAG: DUF424 family protein [Nanoarchaeota archaeon]
MIYLKRNQTKDNEVVAICDEDLLGKKFSENNLKLEITKRFYKGEIIADEKIIEILQNARNINIVGKDSVKLAVKAGIIDESNIIKIKKIPHALVFEI